MQQAQCCCSLCGAFEAAVGIVCKNLPVIKPEMLGGCIISAPKLQIVTVALHPDGVVINVVVIDE